MMWFSLFQMLNTGFLTFLQFSRFKFIETWPADEFSLTFHCTWVELPMYYVALAALY
jgi:hypothetical protein